MMMGQGIVFGEVFMWRRGLCTASLLLAFCFAVSGNSQTNSQATFQTNHVAPVSVPGDGNVTEWMSGLHIPPVLGLPFFREGGAGNGESTSGWHADYAQNLQSGRTRLVGTHAQ